MSFFYVLTDSVFFQFQLYFIFQLQLTLSYFSVILSFQLRNSVEVPPLGSLRHYTPSIENFWLRHCTKKLWQKTTTKKQYQKMSAINVPVSNPTFCSLVQQWTTTTTPV